MNEAQLTKWIDELIDERNDLRKENQHLKEQLKQKSVSMKSWEDMREDEALFEKEEERRGNKR